LTFGAYLESRLEGESVKLASGPAGFGKKEEYFLKE
jgi:hypothetical protein